MVFNAHATDLLIGHLNDSLSSRSAFICGLEFKFTIVPFSPNCPVAIDVCFIEPQGKNVHCNTYTDFNQFLSVYEICLSHKDNIFILNTLKSVFS